jgi:hypothetical protein
MLQSPPTTFIDYCEIYKLIKEIIIPEISICHSSATLFFGATGFLYSLLALEKEAKRHDVAKSPAYLPSILQLLHKNIEKTVEIIVYICTQPQAPVV